MRQSVTILLVEDDKSMLDGISDLLQTIDIGYDVRVLTAGDGRAGLEAMQTNTPDLIVSDIMMPLMDGYEFLTAVRQNPDWLQIPFIFLTAKGERADIHHGKLSGADLYITKPFSTRELIELVQSQLSKAFVRRESRQQHTKSLKKGILQILNHEFRTPLTYVTAYYEMLADSVVRLAEGENFNEYLQGIQAGCVRLTNLVEDLIQVIELKTGEAQKNYRMNAAPLPNVTDILTAVVNEYRQNPANNKLTIHYTPTFDLPEIMGNAAHLHTIFNCLLNNAVKFTNQRGSAGDNVYVSVQTAADSVQFIFQDEGVGFPDKVAANLFELFFQYNRGMAEQQGAGVGLTIAQGLVNLHRGQIEAMSQKGKGGKFIVTLPIYHPDIATPTEGFFQGDGETAQPATVLVVEDELFLLAGLQELLEIYTGRYRLHVLTAANGREGLEVLQNHRPDLIISDIMMPYMDGYQFLEKVRQNANWLDIPFIFLTAKGERLDIHRGFLSGAEEYITKPYDSHKLLELVTVQLDRYFQAQDLMAQSFEELKESILNLITPDFRLPLNTVSDFSARLSDELQETQTPDQLKESLRGIQNGSLRLTRLVEDFIALAELKAGEAEIAYNLRVQPVYNLDLMFIEMGQLQALEAEKLGVKVKYPLSQDLPPIFGDSSIIIDSARRLVKMAVWFCSQQDDHRQVHLEVVYNTTETYLSVHFHSNIAPAVYENMQSILADDGLDQIDLFEMAPSLNIAKGYIRLNNGRLELTRDENNLITFIITLPVHQPEPTTS